MSLEPKAAPQRTVPKRGYVLVVNANPRTGVPTVLGELTQNVDELDTFGLSWRQLRTVPLYKLIHQQPRLHQKIVDLAQSRKTPTQLLIRFSGQELELLKEQPLALSSSCALRYFYQLLQERRIGAAEFLRAISPETVMQRSAHLDLRQNSHLTLVTQGTPISGGPVKGVLVRDQDISMLRSGNSAGYIVLIGRIEAHHTALLNEPDCVGVLALRGSPADHFALIAREKSFPYMILEMHAMNDTELRCPTRALPFGTFLTADFTTGHVYLGDGVLDWKQEDPAIATARQLLTERDSPIPLRLNVDTADDMSDGLPTDVTGIGLLRTEHMLRRGGMEGMLRQFMESKDEQAQKEALAAFYDFFYREFVRCFTFARGFPVTIRLLDYPLHELGGSLSTEVNPMLGLRGVRQGIQWPALYLAQIEAMLQAAISARGQESPLRKVEVMIPLVDFVEEVREVRRWVLQCRQALPACRDLVIQVGTMIETPAAALIADALAQECDFLSFGTNDLTQFSLALSREDYPQLFRGYRQHNLLHKDPFESLHPIVLQFVRDAAARAKQTRPSIVVGLCGTHAADPQVLDLCRKGLLDYLSVPRHQLPRVKLQAIQAL